MSETEEQIIPETRDSAEAPGETAAPAPSAEAKPSKIFNKKKALIIGGGILAIYIIVAMFRSIVLNVFYPEPENIQSRTLSKTELQLCNFDRQSLYDSLQKEFIHILQTPGNKGKIRGQWNSWHSAWKEQVKTVNKRCVTNNFQGQLELSRNLDTLDEGYQLLLNKYFDDLLPAILNNQELVTQQAAIISNAN